MSLLHKNKYNQIRLKLFQYNKIYWLTLSRAAVNHENNSYENFCISIKCINCVAKTLFSNTIPSTSRTQITHSKNRGHEKLTENKSIFAFLQADPVRMSAVAWICKNVATPCVTIIFQVEKYFDNGITYCTDTPMLLLFG